MVSIIAVVNLKGGVGKSTIAVNLACEFAGLQSVILVDADSQATATDWAQRGDLPAQIETLPLDSESQVESWVERVLKLHADHVVIDCPPHIGPATLAATGIADIVLIPVTPSVADLAATAMALDLVHDTQGARFRTAIPTHQIFPNRLIIPVRPGPLKEKAAHWTTLRPNRLGPAETIH